MKERLIPRIFGFELLMAPHTICHLKLSLPLAELGYEFLCRERLNIFLINTLVPGIPHIKGEAGLMLDYANKIKEGSRAAVNVKRERPILVVMGNPPYSGLSANKNKGKQCRWIEDFLKGKVADVTFTATYYDVDGIPPRRKEGLASG